jgi:hypothetical protein
VSKGGTLASGQKRKMGRPKKVIDWDEIERLSKIFCTYEEIEAVTGHNIKTLKQYPEFLPLYKRGREYGKMSLRRKQLHHADRSVAMAIFLGKVYLGQREQDVLDVQNADQRLKDIAEAIKSRDG